MDKVARFLKVSKQQYLKDTDNLDFYDDIKLPKRATKYSAGYDFYIPYDVTISPNETIKVATGIRCEMEGSYVLMLFPRSSLGFKYRLMLDNTVGIIDADYFNALNEGHIFIKVTNHSDKVITLNKGDAFAQGVFLSYGITLDDDVEEERTGGFGSTNK